MALDCLLVHVPKLLERSPLLGWCSRIDFLSMGTLSIAEALTEAGFRCRILHLGVEKQLDRRFSLVDAVVASGAPVVALSLHWHPQTYDAIEAARQIKEALPDRRVVLGGLTATAFARPLLTAYPFVDAVIRGEAERPLVHYLEATLGPRPLAEVDNLTYRDGGAIAETPLRFVSDGAAMSGWSFAAFDLLEHREQYLRQTWRRPWDAALLKALPAPTPTLFGAALGRGCMGTCTWCAGSFGPMKQLTGRRRTAWRTPERIVDTVRRAREAGFERLYTCFDPLPGRTPEVVAIIEALGALRPRVALDFEAFGLPPRELVDAFARHLDPTSKLIVSPETADEGRRREHRAFPFTNRELEDSLRYLSARRVQTDLYFVVGLPGETRATILETRRYQERLVERFPTVDGIYTWPLEMEPGSPWFLHPERYGLTLRRRTIEDFHTAHGAPDPGLGYDLPTLDEATLLGLHLELFSGVDADGRRALAAHFEGQGRRFAEVRDHRPRVAHRAPAPRRKKGG